MKTIWIIAITLILALKIYGQESPDTLTIQDGFSTTSSENTSFSEAQKPWELRGNLRSMGKVFTESPYETDLLESKLKLELISTLGKKSAFRVLGYTTYQYPQKELKFDLKDAYIDYYTKYIDFRIGQQTITWGKADEINPTDVLSPQDMSNITEDKTIRKIGLFQTKADIKFYDFVLTAIWKPVFEYTQIPAPDSRWAFFTLPEGTLLPAAEYPENKIENTEWAFKLARTVSSVDFSVSYFDGWDNLTSPVYNSTTQQLNKLVTHRTKMFGADFATSIKSIGFWGEGAYFLTEDNKGESTDIKNPYIQYVIGADYEFKYKIRLNVQYFQELITKVDNDAERTIEEENISKLGMILPLQQALTCRIEKKFGNAEQYRVELFGIYDLKNNGILFMPKIGVSPEDGFNVEAGYILFNGTSDSFLTRFQHNDEVYLKCTYSF